ncbi:hypothetical protein [Kribbella sp. CA-293567]|uniref:hypothetical protein n=1 Tax=Kribbella sp. CA-293567 TaxID=3002436 RepID=UPI0022DD2C6D|nr:hypothetical protein [Kribbella sp. CA-293567]WBQ03058.1 hypothetical protein OX958_24115 [Kribbella sp. CA-293567]
MRWKRVLTRVGGGKEAGWFLLLVAVLVLLVAGGVRFYRDYAALSASGAPLDDRGSAYLYFDRPGVTASLEVTVRDATLDFDVQVDRAYAGAEVGYFLVLTGNAVYASGGEVVDGCPGDAVRSTGEMRCQVGKLDPAMTNAAPELPTEASVVSGRIVRGDDGLRASIGVDTGRGFSNADGKRVYFGLPAIGTSYLPAGERAGVTFPLAGAKVAVPERLTLSIDYGELPVTNRAENVSPEPLVAGTLFWYEEDVSAIKGRGSLVDSITEDDEQRTLFLAGLYVGLATAFLPLLLPALWRSGRRIRRSASLQP